MRTNIHVRLPRALHDTLSERSVEQDISLNGLIVALLASAVGFTLTDKVEETPEGVQLPQSVIDEVQRILDAEAQRLLEVRLQAGATP